MMKYIIKIIIVFFIFFLSGCSQSLEEAIINGNIEIVKSMISKGTDINQDLVNYEDHTPLSLAMYEKQNDIAKYFIENGANLENDEFELSPLYLSINKQDIDMIELLKDYGVMITTSKYEIELYLREAKKTKNDEIIQLIEEISEKNALELYETVKKDLDNSSYFDEYDLEKAKMNIDIVMNVYPNNQEYREMKDDIIYKYNRIPVDNNHIRFEMNSTTIYIKKYGDYYYKELYEKYEEDRIILEYYGKKRGDASDLLFEKAKRSFHITVRNLSLSPLYFSVYDFTMIGEDGRSYSVSEADMESVNLQSRTYQSGNIYFATYVRPWKLIFQGNGFKLEKKFIYNSDYKFSIYNLKVK